MREDKGDRFWLGDEINSIPCCTGTRMTVLHKDPMNRITATCQNGCFAKMDDHAFTSHQATTLSKWMFSPKLVFK